MDAAGFAELYRTYAPLVHARARGLVGDEADEVVQDVFVRLWRAPPDKEGTASWIYITSTNLCLDRLRRRARRDTHWEDSLRQSVEARGAGASLETLLADKEICRRLLLRIDERSQRIVSMIYFDEMTQDEAAAVLGVSRKTVNERLARFHERAGKLLGKWA